MLQAFSVLSVSLWPQLPCPDSSAAQCRGFVIIQCFTCLTWLAVNQQAQLCVYERCLIAQTLQLQMQLLYLASSADQCLSFCKSGQEVHWGPSRVMRLRKTPLTDALQDVPCSFGGQAVQDLIKLSRPVQAMQCSQHAKSLRMPKCAAASMTMTNSLGFMPCIPHQQM